MNAYALDVKGVATVPVTAAAARRGTGEGLDVVLACVTLAAFSGPGMMFLGLTDGPNAQPTPLLRLFWPPVYALAFLLMARRWREIRRAWRAGLMVAAPVLGAWATRFWSLAPDDTGRRGLALFMTTLFGFVLGAGFTGRALVRIVAATTFWLALGSAVTALAAPRFGVEQLVNQGDWRGLWDTKNALAAFMMLGAVASACAAFSGAGWVISGTSFALCLLDLLMSQGKTALVSLMLSLALLAAYHLGRRGAAWAVLTAWTAGAAALAAVFVAGFAPQLFFKATGKDATLTGRTELWAGVIQAIGDRPWLGYGYQAFWSGVDPHVIEIWRIIRWNAPNAHNGYLEVLLGLGLVGLVVTVAVLLQALIRSVRLLAWRETFQAGAIALALAGGISTETFTEAVLVQQSDIDWFLLLLVSFAACSLILSQRRPEALQRGVLVRARPLQPVAPVA